MPFSFKDNHSPSENDDPIHYAGFSVRALAAIIDSAIFVPFIFLSTYNQLSIKYLPLELIIIVIVMFYKPLMEWKYQATLGKMAMKIKVIAEVGGPMTLAQSFVRSLIFIGSSVISALIDLAVFSHPDFYEVTTFKEMVKFPPYLSYGSAHDSLMFILMISISFVIFDQRHQGVHDKMGRTLVVH
ncbi:MAG: putative RDD family membrane protein YckC [Polaribacter sp.]|jgi:uncharacterized RDD family membrane protein YckC